MENKNQTPKKRTNSYISGLAKAGHEIEQSIVGSQHLNNIQNENTYQKETIEENVIPEIIIQSQIEKIPEEKIDVVAPISIPGKVHVSTQEFAVFLKKREKETLFDRIVIPTAQRNELKIIATALGLSLHNLTANIIENFLEVNQLEIKKAKKKLIEGK